MKKKYFTYQGNDSDCGFASLKILLAIHFKKKKYLRLAKPKGQKEHYSYFDLKQIAKEKGVTLNAYQVSKKEDIFLLDKLPVLVSLKTSSENVHLVILLKIKKNVVYLIDPNIGHLKMPVSQFFISWDQTILKIDETNNYRKEMTLQKEIINKKQSVLLILLQIFSSFFALIGLMFISQDSYFIYPLSFFLLFVMSEIFFRRYQFKILKKFDENYLVKTYHENHFVRKEQYFNFFNFKKDYFLRPQIIVSSVITLLFITFLLVFNNILNLLFFSIFLVFHLLQLIYYFKVNKKHLLLLKNLEEEVFGEGDFQINEILHYQKIVNLTYLLAKNENFKKYLSLFLCAVFSLLLAAFSQQANLNYFLFHFVAYLLFNENINKLSHEILKTKRIDRQKAQFIDKYIE